MSLFIEREQAENDLLSCAAFVAERIASADGHATSVSDVALRYAAKGELDLAAGLADTINDPHSRDTALAEIAARCADFNDDEYGLQLVEAIEEYGFQQQALHNLAARQANNGRLEDALATAEQIDDKSTTLAEIAVRFARNGNEARARELLEKVDVPGVRVQALNEIAAAKISNGESPAAVLTESLTETEDVEFAEERAQLLLDIAARFLDAKLNEEAFRVLEQTKQLAETLDARFRDQVLAQTASVYAHVGDFDRAEQILQLISDLQRKVEVEVNFAHERFALGNAERAVSSLEEALAILKSQPERQVRDSRTRFNFWATIAIYLAKYGKPERALEIALENPDDELRFAALRNIAAICAANDRSEIARQAVNSIEDPAAQVFALLAISEAQAKNNNLEKSNEYLVEAHGLSEEIAQLTLRSEALNEIALIFAKRGETQRAREVLQESLQTTAQILDQSQQAAALASIAETFSQLQVELDDSMRETMRLIGRKRAM